MSAPSYPATQPVGGQAAVYSVVVGYVDTNGNFQPATTANGLPIAGGGGGGGGAITAAAGSYSAGALVDGASVTQGSTTDAAVAAGAAGSDSAKLRAISRDVGASATSLATIAANVPAKGQMTMANSQPVAIASDQSTLPVMSSDFNGSGSITTLNANLATGTPTAGSTVSISPLNNVSTATIQVSGTWTGTLVTQVTTDNVNWITVPAFVLSTSTAGGSATISSASVGEWVVSCPNVVGFRVTASAAMTGTAVVTVRANNGSYLPLVGLQQIAINQYAGSVVPQILQQAGGSSGGALNTSVASSSIQAAYTATSVTTSALTGLSLITESNGTGTVCSFFVNLTAFTAGSSTGLDLFLQWSPDGGTTFINLWQVEAFTAAGTAYIPPIYIPGRWRFAYQNRGGAATTATLTVTATRLNIATASIIRQFYDRTAAAIAGTPVNSTTAAYDVSGCKNITATIVVSALTGTGANYQLQTSSDNVNWSNVGSLSGAVTVGSTDIVVSTNTKRFARVLVNTAASGGTQTGTYIAFTASN